MHCNMHELGFEPRTTTLFTLKNEFQLLDYFKKMFQLKLLVVIFSRRVYFIKMNG